MSSSSLKSLAIVGTALLVGVALTGGLVASAQPIANDTYDTNRADISFVSFCNVGDTAPSIESATFEQQTIDGVTKDWTVAYEPPEEPVDYVILKGGSSNSPNGYVLKIDSPTSPVTVFQGENIIEDVPQNVGAGDGCLEGATGVKFEN
ncbi:hypothetical protein [Salinigranum halophilum]|uniref:hypothetical protein n=1 Tax=Salinigranum halophilum TaxID=2565931 RepID=UPI0010A90396|nr:hypothetical protein [Salinigranum halophilum]